MDIKSTAIIKTAKIDEKCSKMLEREEKGNTIKTKDSTQKNKPEDTGKSMMTTKISRQNQTIQAKQNLLKQRKRFTAKKGENQ